jgi:hypothetical protein
MHDGRVATLDEVIDHYDNGLHRNSTLDPNFASIPPKDCNSARKTRPRWWPSSKR